MTDASTTLTTATQVIDQLAQQVKQASVAYGPDAYNLAIQYVHWTAILNTIVAGFWVFLSGIVMIICCTILYKVFKFEQQSESQFMAETSIVLDVIFGIFLFLSCFVLVINLLNILSTPNLLGLFAPKLSFIQNVLQTVVPSTGN